MSAEIIPFPVNNLKLPNKPEIRKTFFEKFKSFFHDSGIYIRLTAESNKRFEAIKNKKQLSASGVIAKSLTVYEYYTLNDLPYYTYENGEFFEIVFEEK